MSNFIQFYSGLLTAGSGVAGLQTFVDAIFTGAGWQRTQTDAVNFWSEFVPPATETIGDSYIQQRLRVYYANTNIKFGLVNYPIANTAPQMNYIYARNAGAVTPSVNLGGTKAGGSITASFSGTTMTVTGTPPVTLGPGSVISGGTLPANVWITANGTGSGGAGTYTINQSVGTIASNTFTALPFTTISGTLGSAGSTANQNLRTLYDALVAASSDTDVAQFKYSYFPSPIGGANDYIIMERVSISATLAPVVGNAYVNYGTLADPVLANTVSTQEAYIAQNGTFSITVDLVNGTFFYASIFSRSFILTSKTTTALYGPIFASWMPNADALGMVPPKPTWAVFPKAHISEAVIGTTNGTAANPSQSVTFSYGNEWLVQNVWGYSPTSVANAGSSNNATCPSTGGASGPFIGDFDGRFHYGNSVSSYTAYADGIGTFTQSAVADQGNVAYSGAAYAPSNTNGSATVPGIVLDDVFVSLNNDGNEVVSPSPYPTPSGCTLAAAIASTDVMTGAGVVQVNSTSGFPTSNAYFVIGREVFSYTGTTSTTFTGVSRAYNATPADNHAVGDPVQVAWWFVKANGGAMAASTTRPS